MVIDTSALIAVLIDEPDAELYESMIAGAEAPCMSAASVLECSLVLERRFGPAAAAKLDAAISEQGIEVVAFDEPQLALARGAHRRFGRGRHPAALDYGDCFPYALAKARGLPLLFKGSDFAQTDVENALD